MSLYLNDKKNPLHEVRLMNSASAKNPNIGNSFIELGTMFE
jgi:hypothetical protein